MFLFMQWLSTLGLFKLKKKQMQGYNVITYKMLSATKRLNMIWLLLSTQSAI